MWENIGQFDFQNIKLDHFWLFPSIPLLPSGHVGIPVPGGALYQGSLQAVSCSQSLQGASRQTGLWNWGPGDLAPVCVRDRCRPQGNTQTLDFTQLCLVCKVWTQKTETGATDVRPKSHKSRQDNLHRQAGCQSHTQGTALFSIQARTATAASGIQKAAFFFGTEQFHLVSFLRFTCLLHHILELCTTMLLLMIYLVKALNTIT